MKSSFLIALLLVQPILALAQLPTSNFGHSQSKKSELSTLPEFGTLAEVAQAQSVYVYANDLVARNIIVKELSKTPLRIADAVERADFLLLYGVESEVTGTSYHSSSWYSWRSASYWGVSMINKDYIGDMAVIVRGQTIQGRTRPRILWTTRKIRSYTSGITFNRNPATNGSREFVKEWEKARAVSAQASIQPTTLAESAAAKAEPKPAGLTNADIKLLVQAGFSMELIAAKIRGSQNNFDTSSNGLLDLKKANVPEAVIMLMMENPAPSETGLAGFTVPAEAPSIKPGLQPSGRFIVPGGTRVLVELAYTVSSDQMGIGDTLTFTTVNAVEVDGYVVIRRGAVAVGRIVQSEAGKSWGRGGNIAWQISDVMTPDGSKLPLEFASMTTQGDDKVGEVATGMVITGLFFWPAVPFWGLKKGKAAVIPAGKRFETIIPEDIALDYVPKLRAGDPRAYQEPARLPNMINRPIKEINDSKTIFRKN